jgi:hypothetical protein
MAEDGMRQASLREWAAKLSHPSVELLVQGEHVIVREDGELIASGSLAPTHPAGKGNPPFGHLAR